MSFGWCVCCIIQVSSIRLAFSDILVEENEWRHGAEVLCGIPLESGQKLVSNVM